MLIFILSNEHSECMLLYILIKHMILLLFIACIVVNTSSSHSSISTKVISFNSTKYDFFDIVVEKDNNMEIILADNYGRVTSINLKTG